MKLNIDKLSNYDLTNAFVGDKVLILMHYGASERWLIEVAEIKSISSKRGDITFNDRGRTRVDKNGRRIGASRWDNKYYSYLEYTQENIAVVNSYIEGMNKVRSIVQLFGKIEKQGFKMLYELPEDKINILHKTMTEIFEVSEND